MNLPPPDHPKKYTSHKPAAVNMYSFNNFLKSPVAYKDEIESRNWGI